MKKQRFTVREYGHLLGIIEFLSKTPSQITAKRLQAFIVRKYGRELVTVGVTHG